MADAATIYGIATDSAANIYTTGFLSGTVSFGTCGTCAQTSAGRADLFVAKYNATGVPQWVIRFGGAGDEFGRGIAVDASGNVTVTGYFTGTTSFGGATYTAAGTDAFVASYTNAGAFRWSKQLGGTSTEEAFGIGVDSSGQVYVTGEFASPVDFGGGPLTAFGSFDWFVASYTNAGTFRWANHYGGTASDVPLAIAVNATGRHSVVGYFSGTGNFGGSNLTSAGSTDIVVASYDATGAHQWSARFGDANDQRGYSTAIDASGNVVLSGYFTGTVNFGGATFTNTNGADVFLAKFNNAGVHQWSKQFVNTPGSNGEIGKTLTMDSTGHVILGIDCIGSPGIGTDWGGGQLIAPPQIGVTYDPCLAKYDSAGTHVWSKRFAGAFDDASYAVTTDSASHVLLGGAMADALDASCPGSTLVCASKNPDGTYTPNAMQSPGGADAFLMGFLP